VLLIVAYDIVGDRRRGVVSSILKNFGQRVQKSVFECYLEEADIMAMKKEVDRAIDPSEDSVRYYRLCRKDEANIGFLGCNVIYRDEDYFLV
jgi:CRISPR-associated protein Cas2